MSTMEWGRRLLFFLGNDWAEEHHDAELQDESGKVLVGAKLPEGIAGIAQLHAMIGDVSESGGTRRHGRGDRGSTVVATTTTDAAVMI
jgi:hypothetical protein